MVGFNYGEWKKMMNFYESTGLKTPAMITNLHKEGTAHKLFYSKHTSPANNKNKYKQE